jgi:hypothetical protein
MSSSSIQINDEEKRSSKKLKLSSNSFISAQDLSMLIQQTTKEESKTDSRDCLMTTTQNGAVAFSTTELAVLDLFFALARGCSKDRVNDLMAEAWIQSPLQTCLVLLQARDCRDGKGEKLVVYHALIWIREKKPLVYQQLLPLIVQVGSFADLRRLASTKPKTKNVAFEMQLLAHALKQDDANKSKKLPISLAAKWAPSENKHSDRRFHLASTLAYLVIGTPKELKIKHSDVMRRYRELLTSLRKEISIVETAMASKQFSTIDYNKQTSRVHHVYRKAFFRNDEARYKEYLNTLKKQQEERKHAAVQEEEENGVAVKEVQEKPQEKQLKINVGTLFPHEIISEYIIGRTYVSESENENDTLRQTQWNALVEKNQQNGAFKDAVALVDVSGSMMSGVGAVIPITVSIAMGLLISTICSKGKFANRVITFDSNPTWFKIDPMAPIKAQVNALKAAPWGASTNFEAAMQLLLDEAECQEDLPKMLICFSDQQFDAASHKDGIQNRSLFHEIREQYQNQKGLKMPQMVFWNLNSSICLSNPVQHHESGAALLSGYSPSMMKILLESGLDNEKFNPNTIFLKTIEPYQQLISDDFRRALA